jgi:hypothetical protein
MPAGDKGIGNMADRFDLKNNKGRVVGSIEKQSTDNSPYVGEYDDVTTPITKWFAYAGVVVGALWGGNNGLQAGAGLGFFILYIVGGAIVGAIGGAFVSLPFRMIAVSVAYVQRNTKEAIIIAVVIGVIAFIWFSRNTQFH